MDLCCVAGADGQGQGLPRLCSPCSRAEGTRRAFVFRNELVMVRAKRLVAHGKIQLLHVARHAAHAAADSSVAGTALRALPPAVGRVASGGVFRGWVNGFGSG